MTKVRATAQGFIYSELRAVGAEFEVEPEHFSATWMEEILPVPVAEEAPESSDEPASEEAEAPAPKKRGRPKKSAE